MNKRTLNRQKRFRKLLKIAAIKGYKITRNTRKKYHEISKKNVK